MKQTYVKSYAKINIGLNILSKQDDGYHQLDMVMLPIQLHDTIVIENNISPDTFVTIDEFSSGVIHNNVVTAIIKILEEEYGLKQKLKIFIHKIIPMKAGLGGGSSNAGFILTKLNELFKLNLSKEEMFKIALRVGVDVPFFVDCKPARVQGIGEIITPINVAKTYHIIIVKPHTGLSTKLVFEKADEMNLDVCDIEGVIKALEIGDDDLLAASMSNALQKPAIELLPEIGKVIEELQGFGLKIVQMSGSGSAVFAISSDTKLLKKIEKKLEDKYIVEITKVINK